MRYKDIILSNQDAGEEVMQKAVSRIDKLLDDLKDSDPDKYWHFMRKTHSDICGCHYDEEFADYDVSKICYTGRDGQKHCGAHWTKTEIQQATRNMEFPDEKTTAEDIWVAFNVTYADLCRLLNDDTIFKVAYTFWFDDEDAPDGKIWRYMSVMQKKC